MSNIITDILNVNVYAIKQLLTIGINKIPSTIGNNVIILNSVIVTHDYVSTIFKVNLLGLEVPRNLISVIRSELDRKGYRYLLDYKVNLTHKQYIGRDKELIDTHIIGWTALLKDAQKRIRDNAKWGIESAKKLQEVTSYMGDLKIKLSCNSGSELQDCINTVEMILNATGSAWYRSTFTLLKNLKEFSTMCNAPVTGSKFPMTGEEVAKIGVIPRAKVNNGVVFGVNVDTHEPMTVPLDDMGEQARNVLVLAGTGTGKTLTVTQICQSCLENGNRLLAFDLKGNEFITLAKSVGGLSLNLTDASRSYINALHRIPSSKYDNKSYFEDMDRLLIDMLCAMSEYDGCNKSQNSLMISNFVRWLWLVLGVSKDNTATWGQTYKLTMQDLMEYYNRFYSKFLTSAKYSDKELRDYELQKNMLSMYLSRGSQYEYMWEQPIDVDNLLGSKALHFNFGILEDTTVNESLFKLHWVFATYLKTKYLMYNYRNGFRTNVIMEEAQQVSNLVRDAYAERWTVGRSQNTNNFLLTNSFKSLMAFADGTKFMDNVTFLMCSAQSQDFNKYITEQLDITDLRPMIERLNGATMQHCFFLWSKSGIIQPCIIRAEILDEKVHGKSKVFKPS